MCWSACALPPLLLAPLVLLHRSKVFVADEVADTVVGVLDKLGVREACVVGHSYGAWGRGPSAHAATAVYAATAC